MDQSASPNQDLGEREFRELADFAPVMIWRSGLDKLCDWFNKPWLDFTGRPTLSKPIEIRNLEEALEKVLGH
ncbi:MULTISPECIES: single stranded DNA-binding domain-containing protein [Microvirga]|uniref:hypothetical protein n=1 Tax=Microvirga TaxID=186650 RepID=UPI001CFF4E16|nr:hypothetical protein [Microvirga lenta]MCB5173589.1 hypothetical protein [Microvirga lenta]